MVLFEVTDNPVEPVRTNVKADLNVLTLIAMVLNASDPITRWLLATSILPSRAMRSFSGIARPTPNVPPLFRDIMEVFNAGSSGLITLVGKPTFLLKSLNSFVPSPKYHEGMLRVVVPTFVVNG